MSSVDVLVPCYRYGHYLRECVQSVLTQVGVDVRVLVIDDASPDQTAEVCRQLSSEDSRVTVIRHSRNKGHIATYNEGLEWASSDYLLLLSADDYLLPGALDRASRLMDCHPEVGFTFGSVIELWEGGEMKEVRAALSRLRDGDHLILQGRDFIELSSLRNIVHTPTAVVRTELQKKVGGYRPELPHSGDMEMWLRLAAHRAVGVIATSQAVYRRHVGNMTILHSARRGVLDIQQRRAAIDWFVQYCGDCGDMLPGVHRFHRRIRRALSIEAVSSASAAFNDGDVEVCDELSAFAIDTCPETKRSVAWTKLLCKKRLGRERWRAIEPIVSRLRGVLGG